MVILSPPHVSCVVLRQASVPPACENCLRLRNWASAIGAEWAGRTRGLAAAA